VAVGLYSSTWDGACLRASDQNFRILCDIHYFNFYLLVYLTAIALISVFVCEYFVRGFKKNVTRIITGCSSTTAVTPPALSDEVSAHRANSPNPNYPISASLYQSIDLVSDLPGNIVCFKYT